MAATIIYTKCSNCGGDGIYSYYGDAQTSPPVVNQACAVCGGTGKVTMGEIDLTTITDAIEYVHGKVTAIWNQVKP
jgi:DnaJ-class molecular chaperone